MGIKDQHHRRPSQQKQTYDKQDAAPSQLDPREPGEGRSEQHEDRNCEKAIDRFLSVLLVLAVWPGDNLCEHRPGSKHQQHLVAVNEPAQADRKQTQCNRIDKTPF